nr:hypothetical protein [Tanacetum cinerariifolium]
NHVQRGNHQQYARMTLTNPQRHVMPIEVLTKSKLVPTNAARPVTAAVPKPLVTRPRQTKTVITKPHSPPRRIINCSPSPKAHTFPLKVTAAQTPMVNAVKGNWIQFSDGLGPKEKLTIFFLVQGNMSYLSNFEELNGGYVAFGGNPNGGNISGKEKAREESAQQNVLFPVWSSGSTNPHNTDDDVAFEGKKPKFEGRKPQSEVYVSPSRYRNLSTEFEDFSDDSINEFNAVDSSIPAVGQILTNSTNTFSAAGPLNAVVSLIHGRSSHVDSSKYLDDLNMLKLEDITY